MKTIPLTFGQTTTVDDNDFQRLSNQPWYAERHRGQFYAVKRVKLKTVYLARELLDLKPNQLVKYRNGDTLDNRRENLFVCTRSQQAMSRGLQANNSSGFRGVCLRQNGQWRAAISAKKEGTKVTHFLGYYDDILDAARAYDRAARHLFGPFCRPNFA